MLPLNKKPKKKGEKKASKESQQVQIFFGNNQPNDLDNHKKLVLFFILFPGSCLRSKNGKVKKNISENRTDAFTLVFPNYKRSEFTVRFL